MCGHDRLDDGCNLQSEHLPAHFRSVIIRPLLRQAPVMLTLGLQSDGKYFWINWNPASSLDLFATANYFLDFFDRRLEPYGTVNPTAFGA